MTTTDRPPVCCGIDWAEDHHDTALIDADGHLLAKQRITDDAQGLALLLELLAEHESPEDPLPVAIETSRGLLVASLRASGRTVYCINPLAVARYRERHSVARAKSDHADAMTLANVLRTDLHRHRPLPAGSEQAQVMHRRVKNQRLAAAGYVWTFASLQRSGPRAHYDRRREAGDRHASALRNLFNRFLSCLFHCLQHGVPYDETTAFPNPLEPGLRVVA
ncbi:IS110 family transposase [Nocardiopsis dassonvillei]|uniref:Transposase IS111A/IS1328/IS1533 n=1 Tax=Nocardiopsis dassonvillei (strain ATCC 23218 / DSM 43111 / CIP 107115 / JCM 7437 / KCTC 9190 / NBRC 14626 / NCTC 10488 / NRRL B-5397 / IMRU 509) TaxID=446468 RepID=D7B2Q2_NOCDD|nr:IS110 family transposase [Nocardiopsis dassonvillei]ADH66750.1 transposase IS111A/IS1328/IS1533 [Nocardiopsis dassonvillei subsp. dassonvillei DSM 43111]APC35031.1 hypothetical protein A9R04_10205 [Nocardiopsis dassonvillei]NKY78614.1 IS110 family transposase [Nocardiopsis dassonvillei]VEI92773.1 Transposase [Nocardiopsis dassonvillei]